MKVTIGIMVAGFFNFIIHPELAPMLFAALGVMAFGFQSYLEKNVDKQAQELRAELNELKNRVEYIALGKSFSR